MPNEATQDTVKKSDAKDAFVFPASFAQQRLWFLDQLEPGSSVYNVPQVARIRARLDLTAFERSLQEIVRRHETLRTTFGAVDGQPVQVISHDQAITLPIVDLSELPSKDRDSESLRVATEESRKPFDLVRGPLFRVTLVRLQQDEHLLLLTMHHIISDGWSLGVLFRELGELYEAFSSGKPSPLPPLPIQYADYAVWQREWIQGERLEKQIAYWKAQLAGAPALLALPADRPRPAIQTFRGSRRMVNLSETLTASLNRLSRSEGVTLFMTLLAAFQALLSRYTGQQDIVVGSPIAGRNRTETEGLIGFFVNTLALRTNFSEDPTFRELLRRVREVTLGAYAHQDVPLEKLVEELQPPRSLSHAPFFQVVFALENTTRPAWRFPGLTLAYLDIDRGVSRADLSLFMREESGRLSYMLEYSTDLFDDETMTRLTMHFQALLEGIVTEPDQKIADLPILTAVESHQLLIEWNETGADYPKDSCVHQLFEEQVKRTPNADAVVSGGRRLTYSELNARANQLAWYLSRRGVGPEILVGLCVERSAEMVIGLLGILKAGAAYVPLDPSYPPQRLAFMREDAATPIVLTQTTLAEGIPEGAFELVRLDAHWPTIALESSENPPCRATAENLAYVIYTSGSTGTPKGAMILHRGVVNYLTWCVQAYSVARGRGAPVQSSLSFDLTVTSLFSPLVCGGTSYLLPAKPAGTALAELFAESGDWSFVKATPAELELLSRQIEPKHARRGTRAFVIGGENLAAETLAFWRAQAPETKIFNEYGPTETVVGCCTYEVGEGPIHGSVPIGRPIANTQIYVLDRSMRPVPIGVTGELWIGGAGVARGYLNRPELTAQVFRPNPFSSDPTARIYRSGDLARFRPDGNLECLGREDDQIKVRGFRIELGEIEAVLGQHTSIRQAVVIAREDQPETKSLVAYLIAEEQAPTVEGLRGFLKEKLPGYMIPGNFVFLESFPLTPNGKVDRRALPAPDRARPVLEKSFAAPRTPTEQMLAAIWRDLLGFDQIGVEDNFFELGGHSLKATQLISRVRRAFGVDLPLRSIFEFPTISELTRKIEAVARERSGAPIPPLRRVGRDRLLPLSFGQQRLWFLDQLEPGSCAYNVCRAIRLRGPLDVTAFQKSLDALLERHESLRTRFVAAEGDPFQVIATSTAAPLKQVDLRDVAENRREKEASRMVSAEIERPFDLSQGPLWRVLLLRLSEEEHVLLVTIHHIVSDGWSLGIFFQELGALYSGLCAGKPVRLPDLPIQYADYAAWQRDWLSGAELENLLAYWRARLAGAPSVLALPTDRARPAAPSFRGASYVGVLPSGLSRSLEALARREGVTLFMALLAAFQALLRRHADRQDVVVGTDVANRTRIETEGLIGFFVNLLPIRTNLSGNPSFRELLSRVREATLGAYAHQDLPFEKLVEELQPTRTLGVNPLVQVLIVQNTLGETLTPPGLVVENFPISRETSRFDLVLFVSETKNGIRTSWLYNSDLFDAPTVVGMSVDFETLLGRVVADPEVRMDTLEEVAGKDKRQHTMGKRERQAAQASRLRGARRQAVDISRAGEVTTGFLAAGKGLPLVVHPAVEGELELADWARSRRGFLEENVLRHGAILFRGFGVKSITEFERFAAALCPELFGEYGDLPREAMGGKVYGSTPYPSDQPILFHNESSHMHRWPMKIWFFCVTPSQRGGETPIVDCRAVYRRLDARLRQRFSEEGLLYVRNYTEGLDVSWQSFYGTDDRSRVEELCRRAGTEFEWTDGNGLRTRQRCPAVVRHPQTGEMAFFNQLQLHHASCLEPSVRESLSSLMREEDLPRNVYYGNGSRIEDSVMEEISGIYRGEAVAFPWQAQDVLMLNNMLVAHSRNPYVGGRKIVVAMGEMVNKDEISS